MDSVLEMPDLSSAGRHGKPLTKNFKKNRKRHEKRQRLLQERQSSKPLPVKDHAAKIADYVKNNPVVIITAETGCGKSSQVPQILHRDVLENKGVIACTQPRRVAAWSLATRVAQEMNVKLGEEVGYHVRFDKTTSPQTVIKYMTDGILLRECLFNTKVVERYPIIIIDEVHERSIQMDSLLGFMHSEILPKNPKLKLVIMSATMNTDDISRFFGNAPVLKLEGTMKHQVDICYKPGFTNEHILKIITEIVDNKKEGDILVFLPGEPEIIQLKVALGKLNRPLCVLPAHSQLPPWKIERIFDKAPPGHRKVILSTNLAESSITVEGLRFVVDTGYVNVKVFDSKTGVNRLETRLISKSEAQQRRGRVGRTSPGFCYRLYKREQLHGKEEEEEEEKKSETERCFRDFPAPQIERDDLTHIVLMLKSKEFAIINDFPWLTEPNPDNVAEATEELVRLGAIDARDHEMTSMGRHIAKFPLHPRLAAVILKATKHGSEYGALLFAAVLSAFNGGRQRSLMKLADSKSGDVRDEAAALIHIMHDFIKLEARDGEDTKEVHTFAAQYKIPPNNIYEAVHVYKQLAQVLQSCGYPAPTHVKCPDELGASFDIGAVLTEVFASNIGERRENGEFEIPKGLHVQFRPTLASSTSRTLLSHAGGTELFCLRDIRQQRKDLKPRMVNTFVPRTS